MNKEVLNNYLQQMIINHKENFENFIINEEVESIINIIQINDKYYASLIKSKFLDSKNSQTSLLTTLFYPLILFEVELNIGKILSMKNNEDNEDEDLENDIKYIKLNNVFITYKRELNNIYIKNVDKMLTLILYYGNLCN